MSEIRHVVFDLGQVLVHFSYRRLFSFLRKNGAQIKDVNTFAAQVGLMEYEHGQITNEKFLCQVNSLLQTPLDSEILKTAWCDLFTPIPQMLQLMRRLRPTCRTYIISNTSELHWHYLKERFELDRLCDDSFASFEVGQMKPAATLYRLAEKRFGLCPAEAVFIDDRLENVQGATHCGWHGIHHQSYGQTLEKLLDLGVCPPRQPIIFRESNKNIRQ